MAESATKEKMYFPVEENGETFLSGFVYPYRRFRNVGGNAWHRAPDSEVAAAPPPEFLQRYNELVRSGEL